MCDPIQRLSNKLDQLTIYVNRVCFERFLIFLNLIFSTMEMELITIRSIYSNKDKEQTNRDSSNKSNIEQKKKTNCISEIKSFFQLPKSFDV